MAQLHLARRTFIAAAMLGAASLATTAGTATTRFEVLHASPDAPPVDLYVGSIPLQSGLAYTQFSRRYVIAPATYQIRVFQQGADPNGTPLLTIPVGLEPNQRYLIVIANRVQTLEGVVYQEPPGGGEGPSVPPGAQATIRLINLDPGSPPLDVFDVGGNVVIIPDVAFKVAKQTTLPQANLTLQLRQSGTANILVSIAPTNFPGGRISTLIRFAPSAAARARAAGEPQPQELVLKRSR
jgi:Domain of unknown function (DUF4397)